jgi:hypothetical protein
MQNIIHDVYGLAHLIAAILALLTGTMVLVMKKGTVKHKRIGYAYFVSMLILIVTAFMIFRLFGGWGIFHYSTLVSIATLLLGMVPIWIKKPTGRWQYLHFSFMYWSVIGLYAAFAAETLVRIPETPFFAMVGLATAVVMMVGGVVFALNRAKWQKTWKTS